LKSWYFARIRQASGDSIKFPHTLGISISVTKSPTHEYYLLTIKKKGSDKLASVKRLVKYLGMKRKNVAVIGDWHNDMPRYSITALITLQCRMQYLNLNAKQIM
jgi:hydroxymethylpyrimidine pyrophosphatase-like HAD family hydrolase